MRKMVVALLALTVLAGGAAEARRLNLDDPADALTAYRKIGCSLKDSQPTVFHWSGKVYSRVPGERDRHLFNVEGMNVRQCGTVTDAKRGKGFRQVSRELMLYLDPQTGQVLRSWTNPFTNEAVEVIHVANDPVNMRAPVFPVGADGKPFKLDARVDGKRTFMATEVPLFYTNPLGGDYQPYVGGTYHAMEIFDFVADTDTLLDSGKPTADAAVAWVRLAGWLPWMKMGDRSGMMVFNATGQVIGGIDALPPVLRNAIATEYQAYAGPPPLDDKRPNETSWTYFKKKIAERQPLAQEQAK